MNDWEGTRIKTVWKRCAALLACLSCMLCAFAPERAAAAAEPSDLYDTDEINEYSMYFTNHVDGYRLMVQRSMKADMSFASVRTVLSNAAYTIEIYDQKLSAGESLTSYRRYGNRFLSEDASCRVTYNGTMTLAGRQAYVLEWSRPALGRIAGDKRFYACVDIPLTGNRVLTFLFKSIRPFEQSGGKYYALVLDTLTLVPRAAQPVNRKTRAVANSHWNEETRTFFQKHFGEQSGLEWGFFYPGVPQWEIPEFYAMEKDLGCKFQFLLEYSHMPSGDLDALRDTLDNAARRGRTVELTLQTVALDEGNVLMKALNGEYDDFLGAYARIVAQSERPVLFRLCNEMNGDWCVYSAFHTSKDTDLFKTFYRYVYGIFEKNGALANTIWVWNPNERSFPNYDWNHALCYYPGDEYVDLVGMTGYNTGTYYSGEHWRSFSEIYDGLYREYAAQFSQPLIITEFSCSTCGGDKAEWVRQMLEAIGGYSRLKLAVWWHGRDLDADGNIARSYFIDDTPGVMDAFRAYFKNRSDEKGRVAE